MTDEGDGTGTLAPDQLRGLLRDLIGLLALPSLCHNRSQREVAETLLAVIGAFMACRSAYVRIGSGTETIEASRPPLDEAHLAAIRTGIPAAIRTTPDPAAIDILQPDGTTERFLVVPIGFYGDAGLLALALDAPASPREHVILRAAMALASTTLETAQLLERVHEADRRKDEFLALLGHELRNPLAPVLSSLEVMKQREPHIDPPREVIERQTRHMMRLVDDLLDVSRIARGQIALSRRDVAATEVVLRAVELASPLIEQAGHTLSVSIQSDAYVHGDPVRLAQLFSNLLTNAARYTEEGGRITVSGTVSGGRLRVSVRDTGRGISPDMLRRIFEPFTQVERNKDALVGGLGLGLTLVKTLVELHHGTVTARSDGLGYGSEFIIDLPAVASPARREPAPALVAPRRTATPRRVLVVDDNGDAAEAIVLLLSARGHHATMAATGRKALEIAAKLAPEVAILDIGLPDMTGGELAARLRERYGGQIKLISLSGFSEQRAGFDHHIVKPAEFEALVALVEQPN